MKRIAALVVLLAGCANDRGSSFESRLPRASEASRAGGSEEPAKVASSEPEPPPPADPPPGEPPLKPPDGPPVEHATGLPEIVAEIDGVPITRDAFLKHAVDWWGKETLEEIVLRHIIENAVKKYGVTVKDAEMAARVEVEIKGKEAKCQADNGVTLAAYLKGFGKTVDDFRKELLANENFRRQIVLEYMVKYAYIAEPSVRLRHIKVRDRRKADDLRQRILKGESFENLADAESDDIYTADQGGLLHSHFIRGMSKMGDKYESAAFALQNKGDLSPVVEVGQAYFILKLEDRKPGSNTTFDAVREQVLKMQMDRPLLDQWIRRLRLDHAKLIKYHARNLEPAPASK